MNRRIPYYLTEGLKKISLVLVLMFCGMIFRTVVLYAQTTVTYTSNGTWVCPAGVVTATVRCWGAGGGGGSSNTSGPQNRAGGGGGAGGFSQSDITVIPGNTYNIVIGVGGAGGVGGNGVNGGLSSFNAISVVANGGSGGGRGGAGSAGNGGALGTGTVRYSGGNGAAGVNNTGSGGGGGGAGTTGNGGNATGMTGGIGTSLNGGNGGNGLNVTSVGSIGSNYGGGGSGGYALAGIAESNGGSGANGLVTITYTPSSACNHTIRLTDTFGDGWNGGTVTVSVNAIPVLVNITLAAGFGPLDFIFSASTGDIINVTRTANGSYPTEMRIQVYSGAGTSILGLKEPANAPGDNVNACCVTAAPGVATNPSPVNAAVGVCPSNVILSWTAPVFSGCNAATTYKVYFGTIAAPPLVSTQAGTSFTPALPLLNSTTYYWKIVPSNSAGDAAGCPTWSFTTGTLSVPGVATNPSPINSGTGVNACTTILLWTAPASGGCNAATSYKVYYGQTTPPPYHHTQTTTSFNIPEGLSDNRLYYWQVVPSNAAGDAAGCPIWSFTTSTLANPYFCYIGNSSHAPAYGPNCGIITPELNTQLGCIWNRTPISFATPFDYSIRMYFGNNINGADGCTFVFQNSPQGVEACGANGGQLGAGGIPNSLVIEFDTYDNDFPAHIYDMLNDHTAIEIDGNLQGPGAPLCGPIEASPFLVNLDDGVEHTFRVTWDPPSRNLRVYIDGNIRLTCINDFISNPFGGNPVVYWGFTGSTGALNNLQYFCPDYILLPISLLDFKAECINNITHLTWHTVSEINNDYFSIERSQDGINFKKIAQFRGAGTSNQLLTYNWLEEKELSGTYYYRLSQTDFDGKTETFKMISANCADQYHELKILNSFFKQFLHIDLQTSEPGDHQITVTDCLGQVLYSFTKDFSVGVNSVDLPISLDKNGIYIVNITNAFNKDVKKFYVIQ